MSLAVPACMATMTFPAADELNSLAHALPTLERQSPACDRIAAWCAIVRTDFDEVPGMRLTVERARQLWSLDTDSCRCVLERLVDSDFLVRGRDGCFGRADHLDGVASSD
jgi:hypothetical protein